MRTMKTDTDTQNYEHEISFVLLPDAIDEAMARCYPQLGNQFACVDADPDRNEAPCCYTCGEAYYEGYEKHHCK